MNEGIWNKKRKQQIELTKAEYDNDTLLEQTKFGENMLTLCKYLGYLVL